MMKFVVYFSNWDGSFEDAVFDSRAEAEAYVENEEGMLSCEEDLYIEEEER